jgi:pyruvate,orthophosphate dikinase
VGELMDIAVKKGRAVNPELECGICGEHGGDPQSISICHELGLTYVSCSPLPGAGGTSGCRACRPARSF